MSKYWSWGGAIGALVTVLILVAAGHCQTIVLENRPTWDWSKAPTVDRVEKFAQAIGRTEGFYVKGTKPNRYHNPGDIRSRKDRAYPGQMGRDKFGYVIFKNDAAGWSALRRQVWKIIDGDSSSYHQSMTLRQIARVYAASPQWRKTFCKILRQSPDATFEELFELAPHVTMAQNSFPTFQN